MKKPGAFAPGETPEVVTALKARNIPKSQKVLLASLVTMAVSYLAPSALCLWTCLSWGGAPGFYISRPWRLVEPCDSKTLPAHAVNSVNVKNAKP
jgi:hypothetical protein